MHKQILRKLVLSVGLLGIASMAREARADRAPRPAVTSTDPDTGSASSDDQTDKPPADDEDDKTPPAKDKGRNHDDHKKHPLRHWSDVKARIRAREEQVDRALQRLLTARGQAMQLIHGARPKQHKRPDPDPQDNPDDATAPAADQ